MQVGSLDREPVFKKRSKNLVNRLNRTLNLGVATWGGFFWLIWPSIFKSSQSRKVKLMPVMFFSSPPSRPPVCLVYPVLQRRARVPNLGSQFWRCEFWKVPAVSKMPPSWAWLIPAEQTSRSANEECTHRERRPGWSLSIKGSPRAVKSAIFLVQQKIQEKQEERARSGRNWEHLRF